MLPVFFLQQDVIRVIFVPLIVCFAAYYIYSVTYNIFFHPLHHVPGPWLYASCRLPYIYDVIRGRLAVRQHHLHQQYGSVVRTAPGEVSFIDPSAWDVIYGRKNALHREFPKDYDSWDETTNSFATTVFLANHEDHPRLRKALSPAFSNRSLRDKEPCFQKHITNLLTGIETASQRQSSNTSSTSRCPVDMNEWFSWLAVDLASEFVLGVSSGCLESPKHHSWLKQLSQTWLFISIVSSFKSLGRSKKSLSVFLPCGLLQSYVDQLRVVSKAASKRLKVMPPQPNLLSIAQKMHISSEERIAQKQALSDSEVLANAELVVTAGTDTSATALPTVLYLLMRNPEHMQKVVAEIREKSSEKQLSANIVNSLTYLDACVREALRLFAVVPEGLPRLCPPGGQHICGYWIPANVRCQVSPHAANLSASNFLYANEFHPERWLDSSFDNSHHFAHDRKGAFRPFSTGPRDCIGQNFAMTTIKLTLCRLLYRFDVRPATNDNWLDQRSYLLWRRRPLMVNLTPVGIVSSLVLRSCG